MRAVLAFIASICIGWTGIALGAPLEVQDAPIPLAPASETDIPVGCVLLDDIIMPAYIMDFRLPYQTNLWHAHIVPYIFANNVTALNKGRAIDAMAEIEAVANVKFIPRTTQADYLRIQSSTGNNSYVGEIGGLQVVNIVSWTYRFIIVHELMHALGTWHEQQRADRDQYVVIRYDHMQAGTEGNFDTVPGLELFGTYDFDSVMHYDPCSFSTCCPPGSTCGCALECVTIEAQPAYAEYQWNMGNRDHLSVGDKAWLVFAYGEWDCNGNGVHDYFDVTTGASSDCNNDAIPDECAAAPVCPGDVDGSCGTNVSDFNILAGNFGATVPPHTSGDLTGDGIVNVADFNILAGNFGQTCP